jgi:hypothetical protein
MLAEHSVCGFPVSKNSSSRSSLCGKKQLVLALDQHFQLINLRSSLAVANILQHVVSMHVPIFRRRWCEMMIKEIGHMQDHLGFEVNPDEDKLRQIPEIVLRDACPTLYRNMWFVVRSVLNPIIMSLWQRACPDPASIQIANYNLAGTGMGHWHHDESADVSIVVPLNSQSYEGGGTEFHNFGKLKPLPTGHGLVFPSFTHSHRGLPVISGDRYLLVFWLTDKARSINLATNTP